MPLIDEFNRVDDARNSLGMRALRRELPFQKRIDDVRATQDAVMAANRAVAEVNARNAKPTTPKPVASPLRTNFAPAAPGLALTDPHGSLRAQPVPARPGKPATAPVIPQASTQAVTAKPAPGSSDEVVGTANGRKITRGESDRLAGALPTASGPVVMGPNGSYAAARGGGLAAQPAPQPSVRPAQSTQAAQGAVIGGASDLSAERQKLMSNLASQISTLQMTANQRSERDLLGQLLAMQTGMNTSAANDEVALSGQRNQADIAAMNEAGQNRRFDISEVGQNRRFDLQDATTRQLGAAREMGDIYRTWLGLQPKAEYVTDANGNTVRVEGAGATTVTGADGSPLRTQQTGTTFKDMAPIYVEQIKGANAILTDVNATPEMKAKAQQDIETINQLVRSGGQTAPAGMTLVGTKNGKKVYQDAQGKTHIED